MKALSIKQPWAWLIASGRKDIENRSWPTDFRGWFAIHAGKTVLKDEELRDIEGHYEVLIPRGELKYGGIVGTARISNCVARHKSIWFEGPFGFVIERAETVPFIPCRGQLGFFETQDGVFEKG